ncbi:MAG: ExbD/TolR family protein, partial [Phycisphaerales bacterium]
MRLFKRKDIPEAGFDLTAMIDIVLLLIIFFTLTSQFVQTLQRPMPLPAER